MDGRAFLEVSGGAIAVRSVPSAGRKPAPVGSPDFTRGRPKTTPPLPIVQM